MRCVWLFCNIKAQPEKIAAGPAAFISAQDFLEAQVVSLLKQQAYSGLRYVRNDLDWPKPVVFGRQSGPETEMSVGRYTVFVQARTISAEQQAALEKIFTQAESVLRLEEAQGLETDKIGAQKESAVKDILWARAQTMPDEPFGFIRFGWPKLGEANAEYGHVLQDVFMQLFMTEYNARIFRNVSFIRRSADCLVYVRQGDTGEDSAKSVQKKLQRLSREITLIGDMLLAEAQNGNLTAAVQKVLRDKGCAEEVIETICSRMMTQTTLSDFYAQKKLVASLDVSALYFSGVKLEHVLGVNRLIDTVSPAYSEFQAQQKGENSVIDMEHDVHPKTGKTYGEMLAQLSRPEHNLPLENLYVDVSAPTNRTQALMDIVRTHTGRELYAAWHRELSVARDARDAQEFAAWRQYIQGDVARTELSANEQTEALSFDRYIGQLTRMYDAKGTTPFFSSSTHDLFDLCVANKLDILQLIARPERTVPDDLLWTIAGQFAEKFHIDAGLARIRLDLLIHRLQRDQALFFRTGGDEFRIVAREDDHLTVLDCDFNKLSGYGRFNSIIGDKAVLLIAQRIQTLFFKNLQQNGYRVMNAMNDTLKELNRAQGAAALMIPRELFGAEDTRLVTKNGEPIEYLQIAYAPGKTLTYLLRATDLSRPEALVRLQEEMRADLTKHSIPGVEQEKIMSQAFRRFFAGKNNTATYKRGAVTVGWLLYDYSGFSRDAEQIDIIRLSRLNVKGLSGKADNSFPLVHGLSLSMGYRQLSATEDYAASLDVAVNLSELAKLYVDNTVLGKAMLDGVEPSPQGNIITMHDHNGKHYRLLVIEGEREQSGLAEHYRRTGRQNWAICTANADGAFIDGVVYEDQLEDLPEDIDAIAIAQSSPGK